MDSVDGSDGLRRGVGSAGAGGGGFQADGGQGLPDEVARQPLQALIDIPAGLLPVKQKTENGREVP
jgi:hypothetical protein